MIAAPASSSISWVSALTVPAVPTGINAGVSNAPWAVSTSPVRALELLSRAISLNLKRPCILDYDDLRPTLRLLRPQFDPPNHLALFARLRASTRRRMVQACWPGNPPFYLS